MASNIPDGLSGKHDNDLARLRRGHIRNPIRAMAYTVLGFAFVALLAFVFALNKNDDPMIALRRELANGAPWAHDLVQQQAEDREWLTKHGTHSEVILFDYVSQFLFRSAASVIRRTDPASQSLISSFSIAAHFGVFRILFILISCWRLYLLVIASHLFLF